MNRAPGFALTAFAAGEVVALAFYLWVGRGSWFFADEWDFLTARSARSLHDLFLPHSQHWSTLPILTYRFLWTAFGLRTYVPYLALVILLHLTVAGLLRVVMRRSGVSAWVATAAALAFAFFGAGYFDILYGFQIGFCGALAFGLVYLLAADHDGPFRRRDLLGLLAGLASLMCSGVGVTMVVVAVVAVTIRRGWRMALAHALPLATAYLTWFAWIGHDDYPPSASPGQIVHFALTVTANTFSALGHTPVVGILLAVLLVVGGTTAFRDRVPHRWRRDLAAPTALLAGAIVFALVAGAGRGSPPGGVSVAPESASRYLHVIAALTIPALAVAIDAVAAQWRFGAPLALAALLVGVPGNMAVAIRHGDTSRAIAASYRPYILTMPRLGVARFLPYNLHPDRYWDPVMTIGWLRAGVAAGRIPPPPPTVTPQDRATWTLQLALQSTGRAAATCHQTTLPALMRVERGDTITVTRAVTARLVVSPRVVSRARRLGGYGPDATYIAYDELSLSLRPAGATASATVCHPSSG